MDRNLHAAFWSDSPSHLENRDRITHHNRTKRRGKGQQRQQQQWERLHYLEELEGRGPWAQPGEYRRPKEEREAAKAERRHYEALARQSGWKSESQPQKFLGGG